MQPTGTFEISTNIFQVRGSGVYRQSLRCEHVIARAESESLTMYDRLERRGRDAHI